MFLALLQFELIIRGSQSLKDKRAVVRSVKDKLHHDHMVSVAEVGALDEHCRAELALCMVSTDVAYAGGVLDRVTEKLRQLRDAELGRCERTIVHQDQLPPSDLDQNGHPGWSDEETARMADGIDRIARQVEGDAA